jgi:uncharacterized protein YozE (UPF0346 family)
LGSFASDGRAVGLRGMSAMPSIATESIRRDVQQAAHCAQLATTLLHDGFPHHRRMYDELSSFIQHRSHFGCNLAVTNSFTAFSASACPWAL